VVFSRLAGAGGFGFSAGTAAVKYGRWKGQRRGARSVKILLVELARHKAGYEVVTAAKMERQHGTGRETENRISSFST
jgi:hypothetical protein